VVAVPYGFHPHTCPVRSLRAWLTLSGISEGPLWREVDRHARPGSTQPATPATPCAPA